jgi:hypothetical protein
VNRWASLLGGIAVFWIATPVRADKAACMSSHRAAQQLRKDQKLIEARAELVTCAGASCPGMVQTDCSAWLGEIAREIPSVIVSAKDEGGHELVDVAVSVDGKTVAERLDGKPIELNPGAYQFRYTRKGADPIQSEVLLQTGVANRIVEVTFPGGLPEKKRVKTPLATWVLVGVGGAAFASFAYFGLTARSEYQDAESRCGDPGCPSEETDPIRKKLLIADVSLVISLAAFAGAGYFYATRPYEKVPAEARRATPSLRLSASSGGGFASITGSF